MTVSSVTKLPDFRNLGVILRLLLLALALRLAAVAVMASDFAAAYDLYLAQGFLFEPALLGCMVLLFGLSPWLSRLSYRAGLLAVLTLVVLTTVLVGWGLSLLLPGHDSLWRSALLALGVALVVLFYFNWRQLRLSPLAGDARLMALNARIQPHFLFNSLNSVLGLIRQEPQKAETMLENLADLYRALLAEPRALLPLSRELELAHAYAEIETIRFGERLRIQWCCDKAPGAALVPPLLLQPLLENAVLHGVAPRPEGGQISVEAYADDGFLVLFVRNPWLDGNPLHQGHHLALANIRERLELHFDVQASLRARVEDNEFVVCVRLPLQYEQAD